MLMMNPQPSDQSKTINERFTDLADVVSETMGRWWVTAASIAAVLIWLATGPLFHFSDTWQLIINTPTTVLEMWIGFLIAAAANRVENRNKELQETQIAILKHVERLVANENVELREIEEEVKQEKKTKILIDHLNDQDAELLKQTNMLIDLLQKITQEKANGKGEADSR